MLAGRERRRRLDGVDADDRAAEACFVGADARGEIGERRFGAKLAPQLFARRLELAALTADAARPGVAAERVDHRAADAPLGKGLELDAASLVEAAGRIDKADHAVLHQVAELDRMRHRRGDAAREGLDEWQSGGNAVAMTGGEWLALHDSVSSEPVARRRAQRRRTMASPSATRRYQLKSDKRRRLDPGLGE